MEVFFPSQGVLKTVVFAAALTAYLPRNLESPAECIIEYLKNETFRFLFRKLLRLVMSIVTKDTGNQVNNLRLLCGEGRENGDEEGRRHQTAPKW